VRDVVLLATGGTIASRRDASGSAVAAVSGADLVAGLPIQADVRVQVDDVLRVGGYLMTLPLMAVLAERACEHLRRPEVAGLVVTHGTDTTEETAFLLDLVGADERPVVLTGAQRPADAPDSDGPANLADAVAVAAAPAARGLGALVVFGGRVFAARGVRKSHTLAVDTFTSPSGGAIGWVRDGRVQVELRPRRRPALPLPPGALDAVRVDVAALYPGADATALQAFADAGARGIVLEATGAGNANPTVCQAVGELSRRGVVLVTSTRVEAGPVAALYGNGGGTDLVRAGAVASGALRPSQARVLLAVLLSISDDPQSVREQFTEHVT